MLLEPPTIGGFLPRDDAAPPAPPGHDAAAIWSADGEVRLFRNARSALALGVPDAFGPIGTLWRPSYVCRAVEDAAEHARRAGTITAHRPYPLLPAGPLEPDAAFLDTAIRPGDAVLVVAFFGRPPGGALRRLARARRDVTWIEDRAGAALPGLSWADAILYSPRKVFPVPDGGLLVLRNRAPDRVMSPARCRERAAHRSTIRNGPVRRGPEPDRVRPLARGRAGATHRAAPDGGLLVAPSGAPDRAGPLATDRAGRTHRPRPDSPRTDPADGPPDIPTPVTFAEHRARETAMAVEPGPPSRATADLLRRLDLRDAADRRRTNFAALRALLPPGAAGTLLDPDDGVPAWAPLGLPVLVPDARASSAAMASRGVFCAVLWPDLAAPGPCRRARALADRVLLLPCDGRYAPSDMARVADAARTIRR